MIEKCEKPQVFSHIPNELYCIRGYDENGTYAYLGLDLRIKGSAILHMEVPRFSKSILKNLLEDWKGVKRILRENNVSEVGATKIGKKEDHKRFIKFVKHFGFDSVYEHITVTRKL